MKYLLIGLILAIGCAPPPPPYWTMTWSCDGNTSCINHMGAYSGSGQFDQENDCLVWETAFLNSYGYPYDSVTPCTRHN